MNQFNPRPGKYVEPIPVDAKKQDQNTAVVGPTRVPVDEQVKQVLDSKPVTFDFQLEQTGVNFGKFAPGYWYCSESIGRSTTGSFSHNAGYIFPFMVHETSVVDAVGIAISDNLAGGVGNYADYYYARIGVYAEVDGVPLNKIIETSEFNYGDGSMTNAALNVLTLGAPVTLVAGRYWVLFIRSSNSNLANPANPRWRVSTGGEGYFGGPFRASDIWTSAGSPVAEAIGYVYKNPNNPTGSGPAPWSTVLPTQLDFWNEVSVPTTHCPDIWLRGA